MTCSIGGNIFAEGPECEGTKSTVVAFADIVMNHHLKETNITKEAYKKYVLDYMKSLKSKPEEQEPERVKSYDWGCSRANQAHPC